MPERSNKKLAFWLVSVVAFMVALTFAAVPLYSRFCRATGFGGTTERAAAAPANVLAREIEVRFDAAVNPQLPWRFKPEQHSLMLHIGETGIMTYHAENLGAIPLTGTATYNVQPDKIGKYFTKIQCFCFTEQHLKPGESAELPVMFYVDPKMADDPDLAEVKSVTLSYTFFRSDSKAFDKAVDAETSSGNAASP